MHRRRDRERAAGESAARGRPRCPAAREVGEARWRRAIGRLALGLATPGLLALGVLAGVGQADAAEPPGVPCGGMSFPAHAPVGPTPAVALWRAHELPAGWAPPPCSGLSAGGDVTHLAVAGRFRHEGGIDGLLDRAGALSRQVDILVWDALRQRWAAAYELSSALEGPDPDDRRRDFTAAELVPGPALYFVQDDTDALGPVVQEMRILERTAERAEFRTRNVSPGRVLGLPVLPAGGLEGYFAVEHEAGDVWRYYALTGVRLAIPDGLAPPPETWLNQAVGLFRFLAGLPTDGAPPAVRAVAAPSSVLARTGG